MENAIAETLRRREFQETYNREHGIVPKTIRKEVSGILEISSREEIESKKKKKLTADQKRREIERLTKEMREASKLLEFEYAAFLRDEIRRLQGEK